MLVSLEQASNHLRRDSSDDDSDLIIKIKAASRAVVTYMDGGADFFLDSAGDAIEDSNGTAIGVPDDVQAATLMMVGLLYKTRDGEAGTINPDFSSGFLPDVVTCLLYPYRTPVVS